MSILHPSELTEKFDEYKSTLSAAIATPIPLRHEGVSLAAAEALATSPEVLELIRRAIVVELESLLRVLDTVAARDAAHGTSAGEPEDAPSEFASGLMTAMFQVVSRLALLSRSDTCDLAAVLFDVAPEVDNPFGVGDVVVTG